MVVKKKTKLYFRITLGLQIAKVVQSSHILHTEFPLWFTSDIVVHNLFRLL